MLHFCTLDDVSSVISVAGRFEDDMAHIRDGVTASINRYIRRRLDFVADYEEVVNTNQTSHGGTYRIWLEKKRILPGTLFMHFSTSRVWSDSNFDAIPSDRYHLNADEGSIELYGPGQASQHGLRIRYSGGYPARTVEENGQVETTDAMDCPTNLRMAAVNQVAYEARITLGLDQGATASDKGKDKNVSPVDLASGLLKDTVARIRSYRRTLGQ